MKSSRETIIKNIICVALVCAIGIVRLVRDSFPGIASNSITFILFLCSIFIWIEQIKKRLVRRKDRNYLLAMAYMIVFLMFMKTVKYLFVPNDFILSRYIWYSYYIPQTFMVLFMFFAVLNIGKRDSEIINKKWKLLYAGAALIVTGIMTNDFHQLAFKFEGGIGRGDTVPYTHGPLYYISMLWLAGLFIAMLVIAFKRCAINENKKNIWMPIAPLLIGIVYTVSFLINHNCYFAIMFKTTEVIAFVFPAFMEGLILAGLFPSNDRYGELWRASVIGGGIMDNMGKRHFTSGNDEYISNEDIIKSQQQQVMINSDTLLRSYKVSGGISYWTKDISDLNRLNARLADIGDVMAEENAMLEGENKLEESRVRIEKQNKIYDNIAKSVNTQISKLQDIINKNYENEDEFIKGMKVGCVLTVFVKRYSNLLLLNENPVINTEELKISIMESMEYLKLCSVKTFIHSSKSVDVNGHIILVAYRIFERAIEEAVLSTDAVMVNIDTDEQFKMRIEVNNPGRTVDTNGEKEEINKLGGTLEVFMEDNTEYVSVVVPIRGGK